jgi:hypothetical protein
MDLEIKTLGQTLAVGALTLGGAYMLARILRIDQRGELRDLMEILKVPKESGLDLFLTASCLAITFALGILVEDFSKNVTSDRPPRILQSFFSLFLPGDAEQRTRALFQSTDDSRNTLSGRPNDLFEKLVAHRAFEAARGKPAQELVTKISLTSIAVIPPEVQREITELFYIAKNRVYLKDTYFQELNTINSRVDFARSLTFVGVVLLITQLVLCIFKYLVPSIFPRSSPASGTAIPRSVVALQHTYFAAACIVCIALANGAFRSEQTNFNLRIFGYYAELAKDELKPPPPQYSKTP